MKILYSQIKKFLKYALVFVQTGIGECGLDQKCTFIKKSTIFTQLLRNFVKIWYSCVPHFDKVSL